MMIVVGLDQGGSHTWASAAGPDGRILSLGQAPGACHAVVGLEEAMAQVDSAVRAALREADQPPGDVELIFGGLTGVDWPDEYDLLAAQIGALGLARQVQVTNDSLIALRGGTSKTYGVIMIAGSGGNVAVRTPDGTEFHYGYFHDAAFQGGGALAEHAFNAVFRAHTFRARPTILADLFCAQLGFPGVDGLARAYFDGRLQAGASLAPLVFQACDSGDAAAREIITRFGRGYGEMARAALEHFAMQQLEVELVLSGGVFKSPNRLLREAILAEVHRAAPRARLVDARYEPVVGAVLLGLERLGIDTLAPDFQLRLDQSARVNGLLREVPAEKL